jgi:threonine aldolase
MRKGLEGFGIKVDRDGILTNIINLDVSTVDWKAQLFADRLNRFNIKLKVCTEKTLRMVTHNDIHAEDITFVLGKIEEVINK